MQQEQQDRDLLAGNQRYKKLQDLNEGTFGVVMLALDTFAKEQASGVPTTLPDITQLLHTSLLDRPRLVSAPQHSLCAAIVTLSGCACMRAHAGGHKVPGEGGGREPRRGA
jgi:hypothetical protein